MYLDSQNLIVMEQSGLPGGYGDSASETGRYVTLLAVIGDKIIIDLSPFITDKGILRHPESPWKEDDISSDQVSPLLAAASINQLYISDRIISLIRNNDNRTGNGDLISFGMWAQLRRAEKASNLWFSDLALLGQVLMFKIPFRWSDSKQKFEKNTNSSDYLNFVNSLAFAKIKGDTLSSKLAKWLTSKDIVLQKVKDYYNPEPNSEWLLKKYEQALDRIY